MIHKILISFGALVLVYFLGVLPNPIFKPELVNDIGWQALASYSFVTLALKPVLLTFVIIEILALLIPALREKRFNLSGRKQLGTLTVIASAFLCAFFSYNISVFLHAEQSYALTRNGSSIFRMEYPNFILIYTILFLSALLGIAIIFYIAKIINKYGIGNGFSIIILSSLLPEIYSYTSLLEISTRFEVIQFLIILIFISLVFSISKDLSSKKFVFLMPICGILPLLDQFGFDLLAMFQIVRTSASFYIWVLIFGVFSSVLYSICFSRPGLVKSQATKLGLATLDRQITENDSKFRSNLLRSVLIIVSLGLLAAWFNQRFIELNPKAVYLNISILFLFIAIVFDLIFEIRDRLPSMVLLCELHHVGIVKPLIDFLAQNGIPAQKTNFYHRSLFFFLGPFIPIRIWVKKEDLERASSLIPTNLR